jgi:glycerol-1-phosphate dehydrogenase [NAD(P)+]
VSTEQITVDDLSELRELIRTSPEASSLREIGLREIVSGPGAIATLPQILLRLGIDASARITVFSDLTPKRYHDADVLDVVLDLVVRSNNKIEHVCIAREKEGAIVLADELTVASAIDAVTRTSPQALVSVGSGTVVDIGKVIANELSLTHVVVQTAASVNGFADDQSVLLISGVKRTTPSRRSRRRSARSPAHDPLGPRRSALDVQRVSGLVLVRRGGIRHEFFADTGHDDASRPRPTGEGVE